MPRQDRKQAIAAVLPHAAVSRRKFTRRLAAAVFATPAMMSFSLDDVGLGTTVHAQTVYPSHPSTVQHSYGSSPAMRYYCIPEDPAFRAFSPRRR